MAKKNEVYTDIIPITDDFMFYCVFEDVAKCKELLERVLGIEIAEIKQHSTQKWIKRYRRSKGSRLDVFIKDVDGNCFDIEMQATLELSIGQRVRYYHSQMDLDSLKEGDDYSKLHKSIVIFFYCYKKDPFGLKRSVYTFKSLCEENPDVELGDNQLSIVLWPGGSYEGVDNKLVNVLEYMRTGEAKDDFTNSINDKVVEQSRNQKWRRSMATWKHRLDVRWHNGFDEGEISGLEKGEAIGIEKGEAIGLEKGLEKGRYLMVFEKIADGTIDKETGADWLGISAEELEEKMGQNYAGVK